MPFFIRSGIIMEKSIPCIENIIISNILCCVEFTKYASYIFIRLKCNAYQGIKFAYYDIGLTKSSSLPTR